MPTKYLDDQIIQGKCSRICPFYKNEPPSYGEVCGYDAIYCCTKGMAKKYLTLGDEGCYVWNKHAQKAYNNQ